MDWLLNWIPINWLAIHWLPMDWLVYILTSAGWSPCVITQSPDIDDNNGIPGPVGIGGMPLDRYLFGDDGTKVAMSSVDYLDYWLNKRLRIIKKEIDLHPYPFTLRHLDFSRRNIKLTGAITKGLTATTQYVCLIGALRVSTPGASSRLVLHALITRWLGFAPLSRSCPWKIEPELYHIEGAEDSFYEVAGVIMRR